MKRVRFFWLLLSLCLLVTCSACSAANGDVPLATSVSSSSASLSESLVSNAQPTDALTDGTEPEVTSTVATEATDSTVETSEASSTTDTPATSAATPVATSAATTVANTRSPSTTTTAPATSAPVETTTETPVSHAAYFTIIGQGGEQLVARTAVSTDDCRSVYDALRKFCTEQNVPMEATGSGAFTYVRSLCGLREFDGGPLSGWVYVVNGVYASVGVGGMAICPGDEVVFYYTLDLGKDVQAGLAS